MNIGLLGFGTIGSGVYELINIPGKSRFPENLSEPVYITKILDKDPNKKIYPGDTHAAIVTDPDAIMKDASIDLVIALCGGMDFEHKMIKQALCAGKHVVTANKAVISEYFDELTRLAAENHVMLRYEASVGGGIPIITALKEQLKLNYIQEIKGIFNGTTNFILSRMTEEGADFEETLKLAQQIGFAEADPSADIDGYDVSRKLAILSSLAYDGIIRDEDIRKRPLSDVSALDIEYCGDNGYIIKYLGHSKCPNRQDVYTTVEPVLFPAESIQSNVSSEFNIISLTGDVIGELQFYGKGAGKEATANAVVSDVLQIIQNIKNGCYPHSEKFDLPLNKKGTVDFIGRYYLRVDIDSTETVEHVLNTLADLDEPLNIVLDKTHMFIFTGKISSDKFDSAADIIRRHQPKIFYARIYD